MKEFTTPNFCVDCTHHKADKDSDGNDWHKCEFPGINFDYVTGELLSGNCYKINSDGQCGLWEQRSVPAHTNEKRD